MKTERYKRALDYSYALGAEAVIELLRHAPQHAKYVYLHPDFRDGKGKELIAQLCEEKRIQIEVTEKPFNILTQKENCFAIGVFEKYERNIKKGDHIVLVNPSNAGNMGTIIRSALGFGIPDIAIIRPAVDIFDPKTIRASIGAFFSVNFTEYDSFEQYESEWTENTIYPFMLNATSPLTKADFTSPASLVFGNEATGLPSDFDRYENRIIIKHTGNIDSLNLPIAASIAIYEFTKKKF